MTSNIGSHIIQENLEKVNDRNREEVFNKTREMVFELLKKSIRPEFLNRIDEIIMFKPLTIQEIRDIVILQLRMVQKTLEKNEISLKFTDEAVDYFAKMGFDPQFGARPIKRVIQKNMLNELSKMILDGKVDKNSEITIDARDGALVFSNA
jgi:ATP-dependent Clp protease ATP-binding subunit ClpB